MSGLPAVRVDDLLIHPRENDLIVGTHGRGIYILDDITPLQQLSSSKVLDTETHLFEVAAWHSVAERSKVRSLYRRRKILPRPEPASWNGDQLLPEVSAFG